MGELAMDDKYRVVLDRKTRAVSGIKKGNRLVSIPFKGGVILVVPSDRRFAGSMTGFEFTEEQHEASRLLFRKRS